VKFTMEVLSLLAFLLGSPVYLPRLVDVAPTSNPATVKNNPPAAQSPLPSTK
jgi:hypothetical protein